ncbi:MAG: hypothetical protein OYK82_04000 [Gammaproteobacteria bacterium]|nr:hypothetical protein [Gammaproteobacteria bacterium]
MLDPDAEIEYAEADERTGRVNIEAVSGNYREPAVRAKAAAGFRLHANGSAAAGLLRSLGLADGGDDSWLRGQPTATPPRSNSDPTERPPMQPWKISARLTAAIAKHPRL